MSAASPLARSIEIPLCDTSGQYSSRPRYEMGRRAFDILKDLGFGKSI